LFSLRVAYSVPEVHELVAKSWYPRRLSFLERVQPTARLKRFNTQLKVTIGSIWHGFVP